MRVVYFGSGAFGKPTFQSLLKYHDIPLVVTQPDRPAGRKRAVTPTPIATLAQSKETTVIKPEDINDASVVAQIQDAKPDVIVIVAYGQKIGHAILEQTFAMNLHASLLPKYRGAAPINWAIINGERMTGLSVITIADRIDSGDVLAEFSTPIDPMETAGELEKRLSQMGGDIILQVIRHFKHNSIHRKQQDKSRVTYARKLSKADGTVDFNLPAKRVRNRIHGLTPWPGCTVKLGDRTLRVSRVSIGSGEGNAGEVLHDFKVACGKGAVELLVVQPPGGKTMSFDAYRQGHHVQPGMRFSSQ